MLDISGLETRARIGAEEEQKCYHLLASHFLEVSQRWYPAESRKNPKLPKRSEQ
jgi:hypothetical protein